MRSLVQPKILTNAAMAAVWTTVVCYPRLAAWTDRPANIWVLWFSLFWSSFFLWEFVFAWHEEKSGCKVFNLNAQPRLYLLAAICGVGGAVVQYLHLDPVLRPLQPLHYPENFHTWLAVTLFALAFEPLFICFAPFAVFIRLTHKHHPAFLLTLFFGMFVFYLKLPAFHASLSHFHVVELSIARLIAGFLSLHFYLRGGVLVTWWWLFLLQARHLPNLS